MVNILHFLSDSHLLHIAWKSMPAFHLPPTAPSCISAEHAAALRTPVRTPASHRTPVRGQRLPQWENGKDVTPSRFGTPMSLQSPAFTPGGHFVNPFEVDHAQLHLPIFSPNMFKVTNSVKKGEDKEVSGEFYRSAVVPSAFAEN